MSSICFALAAIASAVQFGWQPMSGGGREYIVQVEPQLVDTFRKEGCSSDVPPELRDIRRIRVVVGTNSLPHQGELSPAGKVAAQSQPKATRTLKPVTLDLSRLHGIGDTEDPIDRDAIRQADAPLHADTKIAATKDSSAAASSTAAKSGTQRQTTFAAKLVTSDDALPLPGPACDRPDSAGVTTNSSEPPLVPIIQPNAQPAAPITQPATPIAQPAPAIVNVENSDHGPALTVPAKAQDNPLANVFNDIKAPQLLSPGAKSSATPVTESVRPALSATEIPPTNTKTYAADKPAVTDSEPPPDPTPDNRSGGSRWGNGGRSNSELSGTSRDASLGTSGQGSGGIGSDGIGSRTQHSSPSDSEQPIGVGISNEKPRPWFALFSAGALLAVSVAGNIYLGWIYYTARVRYLELVEELHGQPHPIEEKVPAHA